jgi:type IV pilus assembly protein PilP
MKAVSNSLQNILSVLLWLASGSEFINAQEKIQTPSHNTKQALEKLTKTPATIGKSLEALTGAANAKLKQVFGDKPEVKTKEDLDDTSALLKKNQEPEPSKYVRKVSRDPFRPSSIQTRTSSRSRDNLSPLERFELGQLKVVGIVWDIKEPRAMIEDATGLGYTILVGTPIGGSDGKVKAINRNEVVVEESFQDFSGKKKTREVLLKLSME